MIDNKVMIDVSSVNSYVQHEAWFEMCDTTKLVKGCLVRGKKIVNSYGRVREIWEDGTYKDLHNGRVG